MAKTYWDAFTKSGSISDYLAYCKTRPEFANCLTEDDFDESDDQGLDSQGTEYR